MMAMYKMAAYKKGHDQILTQYVPINILSLNHVSIPVNFSMDKKRRYGFDATK